MGNSVLRQHFRLITPNTVETWSAEEDGTDLRLCLWPDVPQSPEILHMPEPLRMAVYCRRDDSVPLDQLARCVRRVLRHTPDWKLDAVFQDEEDSDYIYQEMVRQARECFYDILVINPLDWFITVDGQRHIEDVRALKRLHPGLIVSFPWIGLDTDNEQWLPILCALTYYEEARRYRSVEV